MTDVSCVWFKIGIVSEKYTSDVSLLLTLFVGGFQLFGKVKNNICSSQSVHLKGYG